MTRRRSLHREAGQSSLVEISATLLILAVVLGFLYTSIGSAERVTTGSKLRVTNLDEARTLMAVLTKDIRTATRLEAGGAPFVTATDRDITFYANLDNATDGPRKIHMYVDANQQIVSAVQTPDAGSAPNYTYTGAVRLRYVGRYLANTATEPVFEYFDADSTELTAPLSGPDLLAVASVKITLVVRASTTMPVGNVTLVDQVRLPNVEYQTTA